MKFCCVLIGLFFLAASCSGGGEEEPVDAGGKKVFIPDYQVSGEEGRDEMIVKMQFHVQDSEEKAVALPPPANVSLDGEHLTADSARFTGVYYEVSKPTGVFAGRHTIQYRAADGILHEENFQFSPFTLAEEMPEERQKKPFTILLQNFPDTATPVRVLMTDTSMASADVNEVILVENGKVPISASFLSRLTKGPVVLELFVEEERPLHDLSLPAGRFSLTYGLRRQFTFMD